MNSDLLKKLNDILDEAYFSSFEKKLANILNGVPHSSWEDVCLRNGIMRVQVHFDVEDADDIVEIFEEMVRVPDPMGGSRFLEMSHEVAMKILTLGMLR